MNAVTAIIAVGVLFGIVTLGPPVAKSLHGLVRFLLTHALATMTAIVVVVALAMYFKGAM